MNPAMRSIAFAALAAGVLFPASASAGVAIVAQTGATTPVSLKTFPNARCRLGDSPLGDNALVAFSDAAGVVRYEVSEPAKAGGAVSLILDCRTAKQSSLEALTIVAGQSRAQAGLPAVRPPAVTNLQTAAVVGVLPGTPPGFDVTRASDGALAALGYPARPDPSGNPRAYALWRLLTTTPGMFVAPAAILDEKSDGSLSVRAKSVPMMRPAGTSHSTALSLVNSGDQVFTLSRYFYNVAARWSIPSVTATAAVNGNSPLESLQTWLGIDGETITGSAIETAQAGTQQDVIEVSGVNVATYHAWSAFGGAQNVIAGLPVRSGDEIVTEVNVDYLAHGASADFYVIDLTTGSGTATHAVAPHAEQFIGYAADWFESRPAVHGRLAPAPSYASLLFTGAQAITTDGNLYDANGWNARGAYDSQTTVWMTSDGTLRGTVAVCFVTGSLLIHCVR